MAEPFVPVVYLSADGVGAAGVAESEKGGDKAFGLWRVRDSCVFGRCREQRGEIRLETLYSS